MCPDKQLPKVESINSLEIIYNLLVVRQIYLAKELMTNMHTKLKKEKQELFEVWMKQESDLIQQLGVAYGDQLVFSSSYDMQKKGNFGLTNSALMTKVVMLYGIHLVENN